MSQIFNDTALRAPLDEFGSNSSAAQFRLSAAFAILPVRILCHFFETVHDHSDGPGSIMGLHRFYVAVQMKMALLASEGSISEFATREQVPLLDELIVEALHSLYQSLM